MKKFKLKIVAVVTILAVVVIIITVMGMNKDAIVKQYYELTNKPENSARQFRIPFGYITVNTDGTINVEFATSIKSVSTGLDINDDSSDIASGDDDRQQGGEGGSSEGGSNTNPDSNSGGNSVGGQVAPGPNPINGDTLIFPAMGESIWYRVINTNETGYKKRVGPDTASWEFAFGYISTTSNSQFQTMKRRAGKIAPYVQNPNSNDALKVNLGGESYYVGCLPISGFGTLGDIVEFTFDNGNSIKVLAIDAKSGHDATGKGSTGQCNTQYCHGVLAGDDIKLSAVELWCGGSKTANGNRASLPSGNVVRAKIVGHSNVFS